MPYYIDADLKIQYVAHTPPGVKLYAKGADVERDLAALKEAKRRECLDVQQAEFIERLQAGLVSHEQIINLWKRAHNHGT